MSQCEVPELCDGDDMLGTIRPGLAWPGLVTGESSHGDTKGTSQHCRDEILTNSCSFSFCSTVFDLKY